ncbi:hypothetical protein [Olivibacter domesticus]|uniref:Uncharacterized protein n=1 Tax=Olivibacter domesticus TaxID=407022 RepID=A0A1H7PCH1_OLID1|nr:hypothetical protein [Olivibacter domesticus]SEL33094.1 hypothetical protein SAMN05661044_02186 [Olivibacter domesticus]
MKFLLYIVAISIYFLGSFSITFASKKYALNNFIVKENLIKNGKLAIIACDSTEKPTDNINGTFSFIINGFRQPLSFREGVAISPLEIERSSFVFLKHENEQGTHSKLYYVYKNDDGLKPFKINWIVLLIIPIIIILIASIYKRLIFFAVLALAALAYFNYNKGLSFDGIFETVLHGIKDIF